MTSDDWDEFFRHPKLWRVSASKWALQNPRPTQEDLAEPDIDEIARELNEIDEIESVEAEDLDGAVAAAHVLLDRHVNDVGEFGLEVMITPPQLPHPEQDRLGIRHYRLTTEARRQARSIGIRGRDAELRVARLVRHGEPFEHKIANRRFGGLIMKVEDDRVTWISILNRKPGRPKTRL